MLTRQSFDRLNQTQGSFHSQKVHKFKVSVSPVQFGHGLKSYAVDVQTPKDIRDLLMSAKQSHSQISKKSQGKQHPDQVKKV